MTCDIRPRYVVHPTGAGPDPGPDADPDKWQNGERLRLYASPLRWYLLDWTGEGGLRPGCGSVDLRGGAGPVDRLWLMGVSVAAAADSAATDPARPGPALPGRAAGETGRPGELQASGWWAAELV